jgi:hypothetical protein
MEMNRLGYKIRPFYRKKCEKKNGQPNEPNASIECWKARRLRMIKRIKSEG